MVTEKIESIISELQQFHYKSMYLNDFLLTWEKSDDEVQATFRVAEILRALRQKNISSRVFDSGLGVSALPAPVISWAWPYRIWMKASPRSLMVKRFGKPPI